MSDVRAQIDRLAAFILSEVPGYPRADDVFPNGMSATEAAESAIREYQAAAHKLWKILDDVSTLDDACKNDDAAFRSRVRAHVERRSEVFGSDGYRLFRMRRGNAGPWPDAEPER